MKRGVGDCIWGWGEASARTRRRHWRVGRLRLTQLQGVKFSVCMSRQRLMPLTDSKSVRWPWEKGEECLVTRATQPLRELRGGTGRLGL